MTCSAPCWTGSRKSPSATCSTSKSRSRRTRSSKRTVPRPAPRWLRPLRSERPRAQARPGGAESLRREPASLRRAPLLRRPVGLERPVLLGRPVLVSRPVLLGRPAGRPRGLAQRRRRVRVGVDPQRSEMAESAVRRAARRLTETAGPVVRTLGQPVPRPPRPPRPRPYRRGWPRVGLSGCSTRRRPWTAARTWKPARGRAPTTISPASGGTTRARAVRVVSSSAATATPGCAPTPSRIA